ncbi:MAG: [LysW]-aminoadipate/[LysW]-glutamate kinase [Candidatus Bathyarchaeia archaeon]
MTVVAKLGGSVIKKGFPPAFLNDLKTLTNRDRVVLIHGGADIVTMTAEKLGKPTQYVVSPDGMRSRYTDRETAEIYTMVMAGKINKSLVAALLRHGIRALGLSGADGTLLRAERKKRLMILDERGRKVMIDGGYTGKITQVNAQLLEDLFKVGVVPVVAPVAVDEDFELVNVDSDRAAAYVAGALKAHSLIVFTDVPGIILNNTTVSKLNVDDAKRRIHEIGHGMKKKVYAAVEALQMGTTEVVISSGTLDAPITSALSHEAGTLIVP